MEEKLKRTLILGMIKTIQHATTALFHLNTSNDFDEEKSEFITMQFGKIVGYGQGANELILEKHLASGEHE